MRILRCALLVGMLTCSWGFGDSLHDGGRDVSVALFSTRSVTAVKLSPLSPDAWVADCSTCTNKPLTAPLQRDGRFELFAGGSLKVIDLGSGEQRTATGLWHLRSTGDGIDVVLTLPSERYVAAVLNAEAAPSEPEASLQALAVVARTYALNGSHFTSAPGHLSAQLCDSTQCQALRLGQSSASVVAAVRATAGETLWFRGKRAEAFYTQHCGGSTEDAGSVWPEYRGLPYLKGHADSYCLRRESSAWHAEVTLKEFAAIAASQGWHMPGVINSASVVDRTQTHRALRIAFSDGRSASGFVSASALRFGIDRALGWNRVRSDLYALALRHGVLVFDGRGYGHGVGLCQTGATEQASEHKDSRDILRFYFPGTVVRIGSNDEGWIVSHTLSLNVRSTAALSPATAEEFERIWKKALVRFPPRGSIRPEIVLAPSTELFRQLTAQPGWALGSTRGSEIVLQPEAILGKSADGGSATLLHEMLHVLIEAESNDGTPLWLREGLASELAGDAQSSSAPMTPAAIDTALLHAGSYAAGRHAHVAAAVRVHVLIARYGISAVRGWLASGVPAALM